MRRVFLMALPLLLSACEGGGDPVNQAVREASARYQAEAVKDGTLSIPTPTAPAETPDQAAVRQMIASNDQAILAARHVITTSQDENLKRLAEQTIATRQQENHDLRKGLGSAHREPASL